MSGLRRSARLPTLSEERRTEIIAAFEQRQAARARRAQMDDFWSSWWHRVSVVLILVAVIGVPVGIGLHTASSISTHLRDQSVLWTEFALALVVVPLGTLGSYRRNTIRPGRRPSDRLLRTLATSRKRHEG